MRRDELGGRGKGQGFWIADCEFPIVDCRAFLRGFAAWREESVISIHWRVLAVDE